MLFSHSHCYCCCWCFWWPFYQISAANTASNILSAGGCADIDAVAQLVAQLLAAAVQVRVFCDSLFLSFSQLQLLSHSPSFLPSLSSINQNNRGHWRMRTVQYWLPVMCKPVHHGWMVVPLVAYWILESISLYQLRHYSIL